MSRTDISQDFKKLCSVLNDVYDITKQVDKPVVSLAVSLKPRKFDNENVVELSNDTTFIYNQDGANLHANLYNLIFLISILSKNNFPSGISIVLPNDFANVVLPHPTGPTIATSSPLLILKFNPSNELNFEPLYLIFRSFASMKPFNFFLRNCAIFNTP